MLDSVLVANRGEVAVRILRTLRRLGIRGIAVFSDADAEALHVACADTAAHLGPAPASESYLNVARVLAAARRTGAAAVHPGYGFLSESAAFAAAVEDSGLVWVGPPVRALELMGDKIAAKAAARAAGVGVLPGVAEPGLDDAALVAAAAGVGVPLMVKPAAGGGGKGMHVVRDLDRLPGVLATARREARASFGDDTLFLERYLEAPRHIELQVLCDAHGGAVHLGERECSLQRRHQKVIEEAPSPIVDAAARARLGGAAVELARSVGYTGVGTVEMIVEGDDLSTAAFLEMNTRLQVEHPVTELVYGIDLVEQQLRVAAGEPLALSQPDLVPHGHAVEARIYAEDPTRGFLPTGGRLGRVAWPAGVRVDAGVTDGTVVGTDYDPMLAKVVAHAPDRAGALARLDAALARTTLAGVTTNTAFLRRLLALDEVREGRLDTGLVDRTAAAMGAEAAGDVDGADVDGADADAGHALLLAAWLATRAVPAAAADPFRAAGAWRVGGGAATRLRLGLSTTEPLPVVVEPYGADGDALVSLAERAPAHVRGFVTSEGGLRFAVDGVVSGWDVLAYEDRWLLTHEGRGFEVRRHRWLLPASSAALSGSEGVLRAELPGTVVAVEVEDGEHVVAGAVLVVLEAMKMEHAVTAPHDGVVRGLAVMAGDRVAVDEVLVEVVAAEDAP